MLLHRDLDGRASDRVILSAKLFHMGTTTTSQLQPLMWCFEGLRRFVASAAGLWIL